MDPAQKMDHLLALKEESRLALSSTPDSPPSEPGLEVTVHAWSGFPGLPRPPDSSSLRRAEDTLRGFPSKEALPRFRPWFGDRGQGAPRATARLRPPPWRPERRPPAVSIGGEGSPSRRRAEEEGREEEDENKKKKKQEEEKEAVALVGLGRRDVGFTRTWCVPVPVPNCGVSTTGSLAGFGGGGGGGDDDDDEEDTEMKRVLERLGFEPGQRVRWVLGWQSFSGGGGLERLGQGGEDGKGTLTGNPERMGNSGRHPERSQKPADNPGALFGQREQAGKSQVYLERTDVSGLDLQQPAGKLEGCLKQARNPADNREPMATPENNRELAAVSGSERARPLIGRQKREGAPASSPERAGKWDRRAELAEPTDTPVTPAATAAGNLNCAGVPTCSSPVQEREWEDGHGGREADAERRGRAALRGAWSRLCGAMARGEMRGCHGRLRVDPPELWIYCDAGAAAAAGRRARALLGATGPTALAVYTHGVVFARRGAGVPPAAPPPR